uniref:Uncharacterized protein n=1 Tax=viral metagenome TaxID=1070528 RepID=A0A6C0I948_9ZZZZ
MLKRRSPSPVAKAVAAAPRRNPVRTKAVRRSPSPVAKAVAAAPRRNPVRTKAVRRSPSPTRAASAVAASAARRSPSPPRAATTAAARRSPSPIDLGKILLKGTTRTNLAAGIRRSPSPTNRAAQLRNYERSNVAYRPFIEKLKAVLFNEKIIDRDNELFETLLDDQQKWNHLFYNIRPRNIVCFIICDYHLYDKSVQRVFHKNNTPPYMGNFKFNKLLSNKDNKMSMKWASNNILYIHKNRF